MLNELSFKHCFEYIKDKTQPMVLRKYLSFRTLPAYRQYEEKTVKRYGGKKPQLYATINIDVEGTQHYPSYKKGTRVKVVMASRLGDVGITKKLDADSGYDLRVAVEHLTNFSGEA